MPRHQLIKSKYYDEKFMNGNFSVLSSIDNVYFSFVNNVKGKSVIQLCCNNGIELMSLYNMGAQRLVGVDQCDEAINEALLRCNRLGYPVEFINSDVYQISANEKFDIVFLSVGSIRWLYSMNELYKLATRLLKDNGVIYISDIHPFAEVINDDVNEGISPTEITQDYVYRKHITNCSLDYIGHTNDLLVDVEWYSHTFSEIVGDLHDNGFVLSMFKEGYDDLTGVYNRTKNYNIKMPLCFQLEAKKCSSVY